MSKAGPCRGRDLLRGGDRSGRWRPAEACCASPRRGCRARSAPRLSACCACIPTTTSQLGKERGGIDEALVRRGAIRAENGPLTDPYEGLSLVVRARRGDHPLRRAHRAQQEATRSADRGTPTASGRCTPKFFDNQYPLPFHAPDGPARRARRQDGQARGLLLPAAAQQPRRDVPYTFFGFHPETTREQVLEKLELFLKGGDNRITELSVAYRITPGTG